MKAIILQPPLLLSKDFIDYPYFVSLGAYQSAAVFRNKGWEVSVVDGLARPGADLIKRKDDAWLGEEKKGFLKRVRELKADLAVVSGCPYLISAVGVRWLEELVSVLARSGTSLVVLADMFQGGMHYIAYDAKLLLNWMEGLDMVLRYEGELLLSRLADSIESGQWPQRGIWENREAFPLDDLPAPAFDLMNSKAYFAFLGRVLSSSWRQAPIPAEPAETLPLVTARGCPYGCIFCTRNPGLPGDRRQVRSIPQERVEGWIREWVDRLGLKRLVVLDELANLDAERFNSLLGLLEELKLKVDFPNGLRADLLERDQVRRLKGLTSSLKVSLESASGRVQHDVLKKNLDPAAVEKVAGWCRDLGVGLQVHCLIGIPGERRDEIVSTVRMAARLFEKYGARPSLQYATPLPGTELERICHRERLVAVQPEDLHACFQGRSLIHTTDFNPAFLAQAADILNRRLRSGADRKLIVNLTYNCNNCCVFCAVGDRPKRDADFEDVIAALRRHRDLGFELLDIDGGEPTLHPRLMDVIRQAKGMGYRRISLTTNGRRLSYASFARKLFKSGLDEVQVSLHAPEARLQERLTTVPESFEQTVSGIRSLLSAAQDPAQVGVNTILVAENLKATAKLGRMLGRLGVRCWNLQVVTPFGRANASHMPDVDDLESTLRELLDKPPGQVRIQIINCPPCLIPGFEELALADFQKAEREMVFVGERGVNLQGYLAQRRKQDERCDGCVYSILCPGFYCFDFDEEQAK